MLSIGIVLDNNGGALPKIMTPIQNYLGAVFASGEQWQSWIHSDDLVAMFVYILESKKEVCIIAVA